MGALVQGLRSLVRLEMLWLFFYCTGIADETVENLAKLLKSFPHLESIYIILSG